MLDNLFRDVSDRTNPTLADVYGVQASHGKPVVSKTEGNQTSFISFLAMGECNRALRVYYGAFLLTEFDASGVRQWRFHKGTASTGFSDPIQGRPEFFPELDDTFTEICYIEVRPPADYGDIDPNKLFVIFEGRVVDDYALDGASGDLVVSGRAFSANPMRVGLDILRRGQRMPLSRFDAASWIAFRAHCDELINWAGGEGDGLSAAYYNNETLTAPVAATQIHPFVDLDYTNGAQVAGVGSTHFSARFTGQFKSPTTETITFITRADDGVRLWVNNVLLVDNWQIQGTTERSGSIALVADTRYDIKIEYFQSGGQGRLSLEYESPTITRQIVPIDRLFSSNAATRQVARWTAHVAYPQGNSPDVAFQALMSRTPDCHWQDVGINGKLKIRMLVGTNRAVAHQFYFNPNQTIIRSNIVFNSFTTYPRSSEEKPNFFNISFRDIDRLDEILPEKFIPVDRPELRQALDGFLNDLGVIPLGVMTQSEADRAGECLMRLGADLDRFVVLRGMKGSHKIAKGDFVEVVHNIPSWTLPRLFMVIEESFTRGNAGERDFLLQSISTDFYSDSAHGPVQWNARADNVAAYVPPPIIESATTSVGIRRKPDGSVTSTIEGVVTVADHPNPQQIRVWRKWEGESQFMATGRVLIPDALTRQTGYMLEDVPLTASNPHQLKFVSELRGGGLRLPFEDHTIYFVNVTPAMIQRPPAPINAVATRDAFGNWYVTWERGQRFPDLVGQGEEVARYVIRFKTAAGVVVREHFINANGAEPLAWALNAALLAGAGTPCHTSNVSRADDGGIVFTGPLGDLCPYSSQIMSGEARLIFTFGEKLPPANVAVYSVNTGAGSFSTFYQADVIGQVPRIYPDFATFKTRRPVPNEIFGFLLKDGKIYFTGRNGEIVYTAFFDGLDLSQPYYATVWFSADIMGGEAQELRACRVEYDKTERFLYTAGMQSNDFSGALQTTIRVEIAQLSLNGAVGEGDPANFTFNA